MLKFDDRDSTEPVTFGSSVCLKTSEGHFFSFNVHGIMKVQPNQRYEESTYNVTKLTKWTIMDARNASSRDKVTSFNEICLKSPFAHYLAVEEEQDNLISANGLEISNATLFNIVKAGIPHLPDWLFKRPHMNHNNITQQYEKFLEYPQAGRRPIFDRPKNLGSFPVDIQETFLIEDLLFAMTSIEGVYI